MLYFSITELCNRWKRTVIVALLTAAIMFLSVILISTYLKQSERYFPFKKLLSGKGYISYVLPPSVNDAGGIDAYMSNLTKLEDCFYVRNVIANVNGKNFHIYGYDERYSRYKPAMAEGVWYTEAKNTGKVEVVVCENPFGVKNGDDIIVTEGDRSYELHVCGVLESGASCFDMSGISLNSSLFDFYHVYDTFQDDVFFGIFMSMEDMEKIDLGWISGVTITKYQDDITEDELFSNESYLAYTGIGMLLKTEEVREATEKIIARKLMTILPVTIVAFIFGSFGIASMIAIDVRSNLKNYAVFYSCGMQWKQCVLMNGIQSLMTGLISFMLMVLSGNLVKIFLGRNTLLFELGIWQLVVCLILVAYMILLSVLIPLFVLRKNPPKEVLRIAAL